MAFVAAKCPACGAQLQLDESLQQGFCQYCGSRIIVQEAIRKVEVSGSVRIEGVSTIESALENVAAYIRIDKISEAKDVLKRLTEQYTSDYRPWWESAKINNDHSNFYSRYVYIDTIGVSDAYRVAKKLANEQQLKIIENEYESYRERIEQTKRQTKQIVDSMEQSKDYSIFNHTCKTYKRFWSRQSQPILSIEGYEIINQRLYEFTPQTEGRESSYRFTGNFHFTQVTGIENQSLIVGDHGIFFNREIVAIDDEAIVLAYICKSQSGNDVIINYEGILRRLKNTPAEIIESVELFKNGSNPSRDKNNDSGGACYIATAVYGSYNAPQVMILREYRDNVLAHSVLGRAFIKTYYKLSPPVAARLKDAKHINKAVRVLLDKWVDRLSNN